MEVSVATHLPIRVIRNRVYRVANHSSSTCKCTITLTLNAPITTKVVCFSRLLKCLRSLYGKLWTQIRLLLYFIRQYCKAVTCSRRHFQLHFCLGALRVPIIPFPPPLPPLPIVLTLLLVNLNKYASPWVKIQNFRNPDFLKFKSNIKYYRIMNVKNY